MNLRNELEYFFGAIRFFTRLPVPAWVGHSSEALASSTRYFPAVGIVVGGIAALVFLATSYVWPLTLAVLASMAATLYITGAFHEDGWCDTIDGFGGGWEKERVLAIMKDSRIGSYGAAALVILLLAKFCALIEMQPSLIPLAMIAGHALSRLCATAVMTSLDYVRDEGKAKPMSAKISPAARVFALLTALLPLLFLPWVQVLAGLVLAALATLWLARLFKRRIGGYTGDCLGAVQQLFEVAFYCGLLCRFS